MTSSITSTGDALGPPKGLYGFMLTNNKLSSLPFDTCANSCNLCVRLLAQFACFVTTNKYIVRNSVPLRETFNNIHMSKFSMEDLNREHPREQVPKGDYFLFPQNLVCYAVRLVWLMGW